MEVKFLSEIKVDFNKIEERLNSDPKLLAEFYDDPVMVMEREGIGMTPQMKKDLRKLVSQLKKPAKEVAGSSVGRKARAKIVIKWTFRF